MPSGSSVYVFHLFYGSYNILIIYVLPLRADAYHTTGLCGNYNLDYRDDMPSSGYYCTTKCEAHRHEHYYLSLCRIYSVSLVAAEIYISSKQHVNGWIHRLQASVT